LTTNFEIQYFSNIARESRFDTEAYSKSTSADARQS